MYFYTYIITNLINGKQYIGDHSTDNLDDGYMGSGVLIKKALKKYGRKNFKKEIFEFFNAKDEAYYAQKPLIENYKTLSPKGYNISPDGGYGVNLSKLTEGTKKKIRISNTGKRNGMYGKTHSTKAREKIRKIRAGSYQSEETKLKYVGKRAGNKNPMFKNSAFKVWVKKFGEDEALKLNEIKNKKLSISISGIKRSDKTRNMQKESALKRKKILCEHCGRYYDPGNLKIHQSSPKYKKAVHTYIEKN